MNVSKVLLIKPIYYGSHYGGIWLSAGLGYISEALLKANIENEIIDMGLGYNFADLICKIRTYKPQLIGISMMSFGYRHNYAMLESIKKVYPDIPIVVGGPHMSTLREKVLKECQAINFGITLEGEETIVELCQGNKPSTEIKGLLYRNDLGEVRYNGDRSFISDLDKVGFPSYSKIELNKYPLKINIVTSRGCPYHCIYCPVYLAIGRKFRVRSHSSVVDEISFWYEKGYREFEIVDDNFSLIRKRVLDICDEIERRGLEGIKLSCGNGLRADKVDRELLARMKKVGFYYIAFGVEGGNNKVLNALRKSEKIETIEQAIKDACDLDYRVALFFLLGSPGETRSDVEDSVKVATKYPVYDVRFYNIIPFQNTELYEYVVKNHYFRKDPLRFIGEASHWVNDPIFETPELCLDDRRRLYRWANKRVKLHTMPVKRRFHKKSTAERFKYLGTPVWMAEALSRIYWSYPFYVYFRQTGFVDRVKSLFRNFLYKDRAIDTSVQKDGF